MEKNIIFPLFSLEECLRSGIQRSHGREEHFPFLRAALYLYKVYIRSSLRCEGYVSDPNIAHFKIPFAFELLTPA